MTVAKIYNSKGITSPVQVLVDITPAADTTSVVLEPNDAMRKALEIQKKSPEIMREKFNELYGLGMTFFPVFN